MHSSTQQFVRAMDAKDIKHSDPETAAGGRETVTVSTAVRIFPPSACAFSSTRTAGMWPSGYLTW